jgi:23S rRNA (pseudouridine1915-N3)-methyltransferase
VKLTIAWIGKTKNAAIQSLTNEYLKRLAQFTEAEGSALKDEAAIAKLCGRDGKGTRRRLVLLDSRGKQLSSEELAEFIREHQERNAAPLVFAVGPADGFSEQFRSHADFALSLGKMTIAHELARVVMLEQVYRAFTILKRHPYHLGH